MESKEQNHAADTTAAAEARKEEATSSETLADIEETEQVKTKDDGATPDAPTSRSGHAPDDTPDPDRSTDRRADEPM